jgi:hypothetical protein
VVGVPPFAWRFATFSTLLLSGVKRARLTPRVRMIIIPP